MPRKPVIHDRLWDIASFRLSQDALTAARQLANSRQPLSLITADAGCGKTFCAEWFANSNPGTRIAVCPPRDLLTPYTLLVEIARAVGCQTASTTNKQFQSLVSYLSREKLFLIIDEADRLTATRCDLLRDLAEQSDTAICLLGCPGVLAVLERVPAAHHRIGFAFSIPPVSINDLNDVLANYEGATVSEIYEQTRGNLRHLEALLRLLSQVRGKGTEPVRITPAIVKRCARTFLLQAVA